MLTDLYLTGHLEDKGGKPCPTSVAGPDDPVLRAAFDEVGATGRKDWAELIAQDHKKTARVVRDQLEATGGLLVQRGVLGLFATTRLGLYDEGMVSGLADRVTEALRNAMAGLPAAARPLAAGLLAVLGQMPTVLSFEETSLHRQELRELTSAAIAPILGLQQAIETHHEEMRNSALWQDW